MNTYPPSGPIDEAALSRWLGYVHADPDNLTLRAEAFDVALAGGFLQQAEQLALPALERFPTHLPWRHRLAILAMARQQWDDAARLLQSLRDDGAQEPAVIYNQAYVESMRGRYDDAIAMVGPLVREHCDAVPGALALQLRCLHVQGSVAEGVALFTLHLAHAPDPAAWGAASLLALDAADLERAALWSDKALALAPQQHDALVARGTVLLGRRDAAGALRCFVPALQLHPTDGRTLSGIGFAELMLMGLDAALVAFTEAVRHMPGHVGTWHGLGWCELCRKDLPAAREAFLNALALNRNFGESHGALAAVLAMQGQKAKAVEGIRRAQKLDPAGLSAKYAQAVLDGEVLDAEQFARTVRAAVATHTGVVSTALAEVFFAPGIPSGLDRSGSV